MKKPSARKQLDLFLDAIKDRASVKLNNRSYKFLCPCPTHNDSDPLATLRELSDGSIQLKCFACGAGSKEIALALGIEPRFLFPDNLRSYGGKKPSGKRGVYSESSFTVDDKKLGKIRYEKVATYDYQDEKGDVIFHKTRWQPDNPQARKLYLYERKAPNKDKIFKLQAGWHKFNRRSNRWEPTGETNRDLESRPGFSWFEAPRMVLYGLPLLVEAQKSREVCYLTEGEKDVFAFRRHGATATTAPHGATNWEDSYTSVLSGISEVVIVADCDIPGFKSALTKLQELSLQDVKAKVVVSPDRSDVYDYLSKDSSKLDDLVEVNPADELESLGSSPVPPPPGDLKPSDLPVFDRHNTEFLVSRHGQDVRYCAEFKKFLFWDGKAWKIDKGEGGEVLDWWLPLSDELMATVLGLYDSISKEHWKKLKSNADYANSRAGITSMMALLKLWPGVRIESEELDQVMHKITVNNGTLDLRTSELTPQSRKDLFTKRLEVDYDPDADCPEWIDFLWFAVYEDPEMLVYLQKVFGYFLTGELWTEEFWFVYGPGGTGKTVFVNVLRAFMGVYQSEIDPNHLMMKRGVDNSIPEYLARLRGSRVVIAPEAKSKRCF